MPGKLDKAVDVKELAENVKKAKLKLDKWQALDAQLQPFRDRIRKGSKVESDAMIFDFLDKFMADDNRH